MFDASAQDTVEGGETFEAMVTTATATSTVEDIPEQPKPALVTADTTEVADDTQSPDFAPVAATPFKPVAPLAPAMHILPAEAETITTEPVELPREAMDGVMPMANVQIIPLSAEAKIAPAEEAETTTAVEVQTLIAAPVQAVPAAIEATEVVADAPVENGKVQATVRPLDALLASKLVDAANDDRTAQDSEAPAPAQPRVDGKASAQNQDAARNAERARSAEATVRSAQSLQSGMEISLPRPAKDEAAKTYTELKPVSAKPVDGQSNASAMRADAATEALATKAERIEDGKVETAPAVIEKNNGNDLVKTAEAKPAAPAPVSFETADSANAGSAERVAPAPESAPQAEQRGIQSQLSLSNVRTTAEMAAHIINKLGQRVARFDMVLTPETMGSVDVSMEVGADGDLKARMVFDTPAAANEMRARAEELRRQLAESGFNVSENALEFTDRESDQRGGFQHFMSDGRSGRRAFAGGNRLAEMADAPPPVWTSVSLTPSGVDLKV